MSGEFVTIRSEGGLLPPDLLARVVANDPELHGLDSADYGIDGQIRPREIAARVWDRAKRFWAAFRAATEDLGPGESGVTQTREQWLLPLLRELGYRDVEFRAAAEIVGDRRYPISHRSGPMPLHLVSYRQDLERAEPAATGARRISPHAMVQEYLNLTDATWGIVTNGRRLRLLRDSAALTRQSYVEFDLEAMLEGGVYADFVLLYLVLHRTRLPSVGTEASQCWLEKWRSSAESLGTRALGALRGGVEAAIAALGTGFLAHPANDVLRSTLTGAAGTETVYYASLLRLVYRLIFLFVAEERDLIYPRDASPTDRVRYLAHYAASRLRDLAPKHLADDRHDDLWRGLQVTFDLIGGRRTGLGIAPLGSDLFARDSLGLDDAMIANSHLSEAIRRLSWVKVAKVTRRVNYRDMDAEELGGVYEGLLDRQPRLVSGEFHSSFELVASGARKQTGSYYTPTPLVQELIKSALDPVIADRLAGARTSEARRKAILDIAVCDPACGSGHFLLAAARRLAEEVARIDAGDNEPEPPQKRAALREVIGRCIYGVDVNPLAVDLCRLALWLESHDPGRPLRFLDGQIKLGNSLVGVFDLDGARAGIPDGAYLPVTGDDKKAATYWKTLNKAARDGGQAALPLMGTSADPVEALARDLASFAELGDDTVEDVQTMAEIYAELRGRGSAYWNWKTTCDLWTSAFFAPLALPEAGGQVPTSEIVRTSIRYPQGIDARVVATAAVLSQEHHFFHWPIEFPTVFERGGFDCVLGNPPWERIKLQEQEFFADRDGAIATAPNKAARQRLIDALPGTEVGRRLYEDFQAAKRAAEAESKFVRGSERFPLTVVGDVNLYALFAEFDRTLACASGRAGVIVPTGIATDDSTKQFFQDIAREGGLATLFDFENRGIFFEQVHASYKFCLLTLSRRRVPRGDLAFFLTGVDQLRDERRRFQLGHDDFSLLNPNTRTCPVFRTSIDAELTKAIYRRVPVLVDESTGANPWGVEFLRMFDMSNDSGLFHDAPGPGLVPLYEAKLFHQFNHRWATYDGKDVRDATPAELADPNWATRPRYWVERGEVEARLAGRWDRRWLIGFRDIARSTDERTSIFCLLPRTANGNNAPAILASKAVDAYSAAFVGCVGSLVFDYAARPKVGGIHLNFFVVNQLVVLPPSTYSRPDLEIIVPSVLELTYTAWDIKPFAEDLGYDGPPFRWDEERRAVLRAELDAYYAALYGLTRDELRYILDPADVYGPDFPGETFRVLKEREIRQYGEYRTRRLVLEAWDRLELAPRMREGRYEVGEAVASAPTTSIPSENKHPAEVPGRTAQQETFPGFGGARQLEFGEGG